MSQLFITSSGSSIFAGAELGRGGEGTILEVRGDPTRCAKIYSGHVDEATLSKLSVMIGHPPLDPMGNRHHSIAWPQEILFKAPGRTAFAGFLMPRVDGKVFRTALTYLSPDSRVKELGGGFNWKYLYTAATNAASAVGALHEKGYCIGDLNESNLLIAPSALITIIDCDSFQVPDPATGRNYRCLVGKPEYTAPELQGRYGEIDRSLATDRFALGVLLFQLLMEGTHPYQARGEAVEDLPSPQQKILKGLFPYARGVRGVTPPAFAPPFDMLDPNLRKLFLRCFEAGHGDPSARPSAKEWFDTLRNREYLLLTCPVNDNHIYFSHLKLCPWCERAHAMKRDSFPGSLGGQIALADPRAPLGSLETRLSPLRALVDLALADGVVTSQEREYVINRGLELQLTKAQVEALLDAEIRKMGARTSTAHAPKLVLSKTKLDFQEVHPGTRVATSFTVFNQGSGVLTGSLHPSQKWLSCPETIDPDRHVQKIDVVVDSKGLPPGFTGTAQIAIRSNGGSAMVAVKLAVLSQKLAFLPFRLALMTGGAALGFLFGMVLLASLSAPRGLTQTAALLAVPCVVAACFQVSRKAAVAGLLWSVLWVVGIHFGLVPDPFAPALTWAVLFASAAWATSPVAYRLRARPLLLLYPVLAACALQALIVFGVAYLVAVIEAETSQTPAPMAAQRLATSFPVEVTGEATTLRSRPDLNAEILEPEPQGTVLAVDFTFGQWFRVKRPNQEEPGWVEQDEVRRLASGSAASAATGSAVAQPASTLRLPFQDNGACLAKECGYGEWSARRRIVLHKAPDNAAPRVVTLHDGDKVLADTGIVLTWTSGEALVIAPLSFGSRQVSLGETVYPLHEAGEGRYRVWYQGQVHDAETSSLEVLKRPKSVWWVRITNTAGLTGWSAETGAFAKG